jgi:hypothetical protein
VLREHVDIIHLNHFYDDNGNLVFDQVIFKRWDSERPQVVDWRLIRDGVPMPVGEWIAKVGTWEGVWPSVEPSSYGHLYRCYWMDGTQGLREVTATSLEEDWTQYDPELVERELLPKEKRSGLSQPRKK